MTRRLVLKRTPERFLQEMSEYKLYVLFNAKTRQLTSFTFDIDVFPEQIRKNFLIREYSFKELGIEDEQINLSRFKWIGDFDTGRLVDIVLEKKAIVTEKELDEKYDSLFFAKYSAQEALFTLIMGAEMKTEEGQAMQRFLTKLMARKAADVEYFKNSPIHIWETREDEIARVHDAFKV